MARENKDPQNALPEGGVRRLQVLLCLRYALPLFCALLLLCLGPFYNVLATAAGKPMRLSVLRLSFHTLKNARVYLMGAEPVAAVRNFYILIVLLTLFLILLFLLSVAFALFAMYTLYRTKGARARGDLQEERRAKILLRAVIPNRTVLAISNVLVLPLALFPEIFSFVSGRFSVATANVFYVRCNVTAIVVAVFVLVTLALAVYLRRYERALGADLYAIEDGEEAEKTEENGES